MDYLKLLNQSYETIKNFNEVSNKLEYLSNYIFEFTTYDGGVDELFAKKAIEVCEAITNKTTFEYFEISYTEDGNNYQWYLIMVNMPFFKGKLEWGTSIRGAWWVYDDITIESCGLFDENKEQILKLTFDNKQWPEFIKALIEFSKE